MGLLQLHSSAFLSLFSDAENEIETSRAGASEPSPERAPPAGLQVTLINPDGTLDVEPSDASCPIHNDFLGNLS